MRRQAFISLAMGIACTTGIILSACSSDDDPPGGSPDSGTTDSGADRNAPGTDSGGGTDANNSTDARDSSTPTDANDGGNPTDANADADADDLDANIDPDATTTPDADADPGPTKTVTIGSTGFIQVQLDAVLANFYEDDTIIRFSHAPSCVMHVRSQTKPASPAGTLTVGGPIVGSDGGTDQIITVTGDPTSNQYFYFNPVYPANDALQLQLDGTPTAVFPAIPVQTMRPSAADPVVVSQPALEDAAANFVLSTTQAMNVAWTVPTTGTSADKQISAVFQVFGSGAGKNAALFCQFPLTAGTATIPAELIAEMKSQSNAVDGIFHVWSGSAKELVIGSTSYVIEVARFDSTTLVADPNFTF